MTLFTVESEYISITKGAAHALEVRSAYDGMWDDVQSGV